RFLPAPPEGDGARYGLALENQNGWIGHNGNIYSYMVYPYYLPSKRMTMVVMLNTGADIPGAWAMVQAITRIISPNNVWPGLPKERSRRPGEQDAVPTGRATGALRSYRGPLDAGRLAGRS